MQQYQCIKQPKDLNRNIYRRLFVVVNVYIDRTGVSYEYYVELYCEDLDYYITINQPEFLKYFVKYPYVTNIIKEEIKEMDKIKRHKEVCEHLNKVYQQKNQKYGDSFGISVRKYGLISALTRISDKFNRFEQIILEGSNGTADETLIDTCIDAANYFLMTAIELEALAEEQELCKPRYGQAPIVEKKPTPEDLEDLFKLSINTD